MTSEPTPQPARAKNDRWCGVSQVPQTQDQLSDERIAAAAELLARPEVEHWTTVEASDEADDRAEALHVLIAAMPALLARAQTAEAERDEAYRRGRSDGYSECMREWQTSR